MDKDFISGKRISVPTETLSEEMLEDIAGKNAGAGTMPVPQEVIESEETYDEEEVIGEAGDIAPDDIESDN